MRRIVDNGGFLCLAKVHLMRLDGGRGKKWVAVRVDRHEGWIVAMRWGDDTGLNKTVRVVVGRGQLPEVARKSVEK